MFYILYIDECNQKNTPKECYQSRVGLSLRTLTPYFAIQYLLQDF